MQSHPPLAAEDIRGILSSKIAPVQLPLTYRLGLAGCMLGLILLQALYLCLAILVGFLAAKYFLWAGPPLLNHPNFGTILFAFGPPIAGAIAMFFLFKPLLSRLPKPPENLELKQDDAPMLFLFVAQVCAAVGAPMPRRIEVDLQVNASASLRRGWRGFFGNELTLCIGLPLAANLDVKQFAGVLAHEFGHFTQATGMRLGYVSHSIRLWFARVAHERDSWDVWLDETYENGGWRTRAVLGMAKGAVWLSRWVLRGLLMAANWMSAWFGRQQELDADRHQAALVGGALLKETHLRLRILDSACSQAWKDVSQSWRVRRLAANFVSVVEYYKSHIDEESRIGLREAMMAETTERWATHPATSDRIRYVEGITGLWRDASDQLARSLFSDFEQICERATNHNYGHSLGDAVRSATFVPAVHYRLDAERRAARLEAKRMFFFNVSMPSKWFILPPKHDRSAKLTWLKADRDDMSEYWSALEVVLDRNAAIEFLRADGKINPVSFKVSSTNREIVEREALTAHAELNQEIEKLRKRYHGNGLLLTQDAAEIRTAYQALSEEQPALLQLCYLYNAARTMAGNLQFLPLATASLSRDNLLERVRESAQTILRRLSIVSWPLESAIKAATLTDEILHGSPVEKLDSLELADILLERANMVAEDLLGELCFLSKRSADESESEVTPR